MEVNVKISLPKSYSVLCITTRIFCAGRAGGFTTKLSDFHIRGIFAGLCVSN